MKTLQWMFQGDKNFPGGYPYVAKCMTEALEDIHVDLKTLSQTLVFHTVPWSGFSWYPGQRSAILTMWEHSHVPEGVGEGLRLFELALPPCHYSAELFKPYIQSEVIPHGIDPNVYYPADNPLRRPQKLRILTAATNQRKGTAEVMKAVEASGIPYELVLKGKRAYEFLPADTDTMSTVKEATTNMREFYQSFDLYISGSRGEGWDLIAWEALACGVPVIVPDHTGYKDWNWLAQKTLEKWEEQPSLVRVFGNSGNWNVMDTQEITEAVQECWQDYPDWKKHALDSSEYMRVYCTWKHSAMMLVGALEKHHFKLEPFVPKGMKEEHLPLVHVRCTQGMNEGFDVGGFCIAPFKEGVEYRLPVEPARVLVEAGVAELV